MIDKLYGKYFQKSKSFLYPILGIKRTGIKPLETYVSLEGRVNPEDVKLVCTFKHSDSVEFKTFEENMLIGNPLFVEKIQAKDFNIYVFDLEIHQNDYFNFILGKYSRLSNVTKKAIKDHFGERSAEYRVIESYLYPEKHFENYATLLDIDVEMLKQIGELCDPCDLEKEILKVPIEDLVL